MDQVQGNWVLKEIRNADGTIDKFDDQAVYLSISADRLYRTYIIYNKGVEGVIGAEAHNDTTYNGYDYLIKGHQIDLQNVMYLPKRYKDSVPGVIYEDSILIKVERGKSTINVKRLGPEEMICSVDGMESFNHVYRRFNSNAKISTQQDVRKHYLKLAKDWH